MRKELQKTKTKATKTNKIFNFSIFIKRKKLSPSLSLSRFSLQPQRVQQSDVVPHPRQRVRGDHPARGGGGDADPGSAAVPYPQQSRKSRLRSGEGRIRRRDPGTVRAPVPVEEPLVGPRGRGQGDEGALLRVRDDALDAVLCVIFGLGGGGGEGLEKKKRGTFFLKKKKKKKKNGEKKKVEKKLLSLLLLLLFLLTQSTRVLSSFRSRYSLDLGSRSAHSS